MSAKRNIMSRREIRASSWGLSSALLVAFGCGATLFGSLSIGHSMATIHSESPVADSVSSAAPEGPRPQAGGLIRSPDPRPTVAFVPQYSEAIRTRADSDAASTAALPTSPVPASAGLSR